MLQRYMVLLIVIITGVFTGVVQSQTFTDQNNELISLDGFKDKWIMFVYIAPGCYFCRKEVLALNELIDLHPNELVVLGANTDDLSVDELQELRDAWNINFPMLQQDPSDFLKLKSIRGVPTMVIIKPNGKVLDPVVGLRSQKQLESIMFK